MSRATARRSRCFRWTISAWTDLPRRTFLAANAELRRSSPNGGAVFATTGLVTPLAAAEIKKLGWKIVQIKAAR